MKGAKSWVAKNIYGFERKQNYLSIYNSRWIFIYFIKIRNDQYCCNKYVFLCTFTCTLYVLFFILPFLLECRFDVVSTCFLYLSSYPHQSPGLDFLQFHGLVPQQSHGLDPLQSYGLDHTQSRCLDITKYPFIKCRGYFSQSIFISVSLIDLLDSYQSNRLTLPLILIGLILILILILIGLILILILT